jgi:hypothetical protein
MAKRMTRVEIGRKFPLGTKLDIWDDTTGKWYAGTIYEIYPDGAIMIKVGNDLIKMTRPRKLDPARKRAFEARVRRARKCDGDQPDSPKDGR